MLQGRQRWQQLAELGARFAAVEADLERLRTAAPAAESAAPSASQKDPSRAATLDHEWAAFEADQELRELKRRQQG